jgi:16S rRNA (guanine966-N2)-methyltransferase
MAQSAAEIIRALTCASIEMSGDTMRKGKPGGSVRIIGGIWRGRRLRFPVGTEVRPTPDRVRETVFNWLGPKIAGMHCLDLFAGTGVFGFEALSRGAATAVLVESDPRLIAALTSLQTGFGAANARMLQADAAKLLLSPAALQAAALGIGTFGFVVLDPPYRLESEPFLEPVSRLLAPGGLVYLERPADPGLPDLSGLRWHRRARAGRIEFGLATPV